MSNATEGRRKGFFNGPDAYDKRNLFQKSSQSISNGNSVASTYAPHASARESNRDARGLSNRYQSQARHNNSNGTSANHMAQSESQRDTSTFFRRGTQSEGIQEEKLYGIYQMQYRFCILHIGGENDHIVEQWHQR